MNSNHNRALTAALLAFGGVVPALAQYDLPGHCIDPNATAPYSNDFNAYFLQTPLFGAGIGVRGTVAYGTQCDGAAGSAPVRGRIGFTTGPQGSVQDELDPVGFGGKVDNFLRLTEGLSSRDEGVVVGNSYQGPTYAMGTSGGLSYARVVVQTTGTTVTTTDYLYGSNPIGLYFVGKSGRYMYTDSTVNGTAVNNSIGVRCIVEVLGDASRVNWTLTNNLSSGEAVNLGLWFGQSVWLLDNNGVTQGVSFGSALGQYKIPYITVPGRKPLSVDERFPGDVATSVPTYVNFTGGAKFGYGLQVVNSPDALSSFDPNSVIDQTSVDEFVLGAPGAVTDGHYVTDNPLFPDFIFNAPGNGNADAAPLGRDFYPIGTDPELMFADDVAFIQKWQPTVVVSQGLSRNITAYYRATFGDSSYSPAYTGYSAVVDTPKAVSTDSSDPTQFRVNPFTIRVNVDNTGGFSTTDKNVAMETTQVTLNLPAGMHAVNSPTQRTIIKNVNRVYGLTGTRSQIQAAQIGYVDFQVQVDDTAVGSLPYTVTIVPQPGFASKTINGTVNVAATPRLVVRNGANLVAPPWQFADNSWESILGLDLNADFQAYTWDAQLQTYVTDTEALRGHAYWIISNSDLGNRTLGGSPTQPDDEFPDPQNFDAGGAPNVHLFAGWNLIGNPYNYAFPLGGIIGVPTGQNNLALSYDELLVDKYTDGAFAFYDPSLRNYSYIQGTASKLQPNRGYWIFVNQEFELKFPPLYDLFIRSAEPATPAVKQRFNNWTLQLSAATANSTDSQNFVGTVRTQAELANRSIRKAPMAPTKDALRSYITSGSLELAQSLHAGTGTQTFLYNVATKSSGAVTLSWPNLKQIPSNLAVSIKDLTTKKSINARSTSGYSFTGGTASVRQFQVTVTPQGTVAQRVTSMTNSIVTMGSVKQMKISFFTSGRGGATIRVMKNGVVLGTVASDMDVVAGGNTVLWPMIDKNGLALPNGSYVLDFAATGEGGDTSSRQFAVTVKR